MSRARTHSYTDVYLGSTELKRLKKGYSVNKHCNGIHLCIRTGKDRKAQRQIDRLKERIKELERKR